MATLSALILAKNEEKNIADCIKSVAFADEVVVVDSGSTDRTRELASAMGARVFLHPMDANGFAGQRNFAQDQAQASWILYLDADERIPHALAEEIKQALQKNIQKAGAFQRENVVMGQRMKHGVYRSDCVVRLFPRGMVHWEGEVHERPECGLPLHKFQKKLEHKCLSSWEIYFTKFNRYTTLMAERMHREGRSTSVVRMQLHAMYAFFQMFIIKKGFLDGYLGFLFCVYHYFYTLTKYVKLAKLNEKRKM